MLNFLMILVNVNFIKNSGKTMHYARGLNGSLNWRCMIAHWKFDESDKHWLVSFEL